MASPYNTAIGTEGILKYTLAQLAAQDAADRARMGGAIGSLIGDYGDVPQGYQDRYGFVTPEVRALAERNPFSTIKQIDRQRTASRGNLRAQLAARGAIQSGEYALGENEIGYNTGLQRYQALRGLMGEIGNMESQYADAGRGRFDEQAQAYQDTVERLLKGGFSPQKPALGTKTTRRVPTLTRPKRPKTTWLGPKTSGPLLGVGQGTGPYIGTR